RWERHAAVGLWARPVAGVDAVRDVRPVHIAERGMRLIVTRTIIGKEQTGEADAGIVGDFTGCAQTHAFDVVVDLSQNPFAMRVPFLGYQIRNEPDGMAP